MVKDRKLMDRLLPNPQQHGSIVGILATTYEFDPRFVELDLLPTCFGLGAWDDRSWASRLALEKALAESSNAVMLMDGRRYRGRPRTLRVDVIPSVGPSLELLHGKVLLIVYERAVRLLVGSANLTDNGYRHNREVNLPLVVTKDDPRWARLVLQALEPMPAILEGWWSASCQQVVDAARERLTGWAGGANSDSAAQFVWSGGRSELWRTFVAQWPAGEMVRKVSIVSPFWSEESGQSGPLARLLGALRERESLEASAELRLFAEAPPGPLDAAFPRIPSSLASFDAAAAGVEAWAHAVDPRVLPEEIGGRTDFLQRRALHAKIVLFEGARTSLAYVGSANFTRHGWGFNPPVGANIEAGVILRKEGAARAALAGLIPKTIGNPVKMEASAILVQVPEEVDEPEAAWPTFLRGLTLVPGEKGDALELQVDLIPARVDGHYSLWVGEDPPRLLLERAAGGEETIRRALDPESLVLLLVAREVQVRWWACEQGVSLPINVDPSGRLDLPIGEGDARPGEHLLLAYYQGRITFEDLFPPPAAFAGESEADSTEEAEIEVDTSRIQSYQMREFVEALCGLEEDLRAAAFGTETSLQLAMRGHVSPLSLARAVQSAVADGRRSATAGAFQLVEIAAAIRRVGEGLEDPVRAEVYRKHADLSREQLAGILDGLRGGHLTELGAAAPFQKYLRAVEPKLARKR